MGKTSLLRIIYEHLKRQTHTKITYMPQNYEDFLDEKANVIDFLSPHNIQDIKPILASLQFTHEEIYHPTSQLSGGQKAKLFLAHIVLNKSQFLILDEPTRHFSPTNQPLIKELLEDFRGQLSVSHMIEH
ncbi:ATP-binding cassette domain-containing protein [Streptococcus didelphis]|uniref:ATP-binding cassette domain-containing protein n=1 Tax=Streptococcus didelphis TaxID=102886 RepID=A0ABY9LJ58_9STRE|nr:ATP-binding cassette domain-containing protein [Streptococcus didelphis]